MDHDTTASASAPARPEPAFAATPRRTGSVRKLRDEHLTVSDTAARFLRSRDLQPTTKRVYRLTLDKLVEDLGDRPLDEIGTEDLQAHLDARYGGATPATFNRNRATVGSLFEWAKRKGHVVENPVTAIERRRERRTATEAARQRAIPYEDLEALWGRRDVAVREKCLWRLLYETAARASEVLNLDIEDLDLDERSAGIVGKGGHVERIFWATGTARLLPHLLGDRTTGPVFLARGTPRLAVARPDLDRASSQARLSYRRAAEMFSSASGGWTLHQLRHSALTHLAEADVDTTLLKAKSRHQSLRSLERYVRPSEAAVARLTARHDPAARRKR